MECIVVEGIYWASASYVGGLYTNAGANDIKVEWLMATPDKNMPIIPENSHVKNAKSLQNGSPELYALVSDTTSVGHAWLPAIMTDGAYKGDPGGVNPPSPPTPTDTTPAPSPPTTSCTEDENAKFLYKKTKKKGAVIKTCGWLASKQNSSKLCLNKVKANDDHQPPQNVCFKTCNSCSPCYENPKSKFFHKKTNGKNKYMTCKALAKKSDNKIEEICSGTIDNNAGGYGSAYLICPSTCADSTVGLSGCSISRLLL